MNKVTIYRSILSLSLPTLFAMSVLGSDSLQAYDSGGSRLVSAPYTSLESKKVLAEVREFIWTHWQSRQLGHIVVTWVSIEGEPSTSSFFIQPSKEGTWCVSVQVARTVISRAGSHRSYESNDYRACTLERRPTNKLPGASATQPQTRDYRLLLIDRDGKVRTEI